MIYASRAAVFLALILVGCNNTPDEPVTEDMAGSEEMPEAVSEDSTPQPEHSDEVSSGAAFMALAEGAYVLERRQAISGRDPGGMSASPNYQLRVDDGYQIFVLVSSISGDLPTDELNQGIASSDGTLYHPVGFGVPMASPAHSGTQITFIGSVDAGGSIGIVSTSPSSFIGQVYVLPEDAQGLHLAEADSETQIIVHSGPLPIPPGSSTNGLNLSARLDFGFSVENTTRN